MNNRKVFCFILIKKKKQKKIKLDKNERYIKDFRNTNIDAIVIEILPKDDISSDFFLLPNINYLDNQKE